MYLGAALNVDEPLATLRSGTTSYNDADGLGSVTSLSNAVANLAQTYTLDSFGNQTAAKCAGSSGYTRKSEDHVPEMLCINRQIPRQTAAAQAEDSASGPPGEVRLIQEFRSERLEERSESGSPNFEMRTLLALIALAFTSWNWIFFRANHTRTLFNPAPTTSVAAKTTDSIAAFSMFHLSNAKSRCRRGERAELMAGTQMDPLA